VSRAAAPAKLDLAVRQSRLHCRRVVYQRITLKNFQFKSLAAAVLATVALSAAQAQQVRVTEVAPYASGNTPFGADWLELTNTGTTTIAFSGWKMDDNSNLFSASVPLVGISSIAPGESVIFIECLAGCTAIAGFQSYWGSAVNGVQIGTYSGSGVGLSTGGDAVNIFDSAGAVLTRVDFGASTTGRTFDNAAGLNNANISTLSTVGISGAFNSVQSLTASGTPTGVFDIGSPGRIAAPIPEPGTYALFAAGLAVIGSLVRRRLG